MTSAQYLTLEEFLSSPMALPTILLPRSHAQRLVHLCELAEMTPPPSFLKYLFQTEKSDAAAAAATSPDADAANCNDNGHVAAANHNVNHNPYTLVTQMALLLYLGEYTHAQHLWSRVVVVGGGGPSTVHTNDYVQVEQLWNAAKYMQLWNTGGMHINNDYLISANPNNNSSCAAANTNASETGIATMQIEHKDDGESNLSNNICDSSSSSYSPSSTTTLPFSTLALRALHSCQTSKLEPLSTYATELTLVFRWRINQRLHKYLTKLDATQFCLRMNYDVIDSGSGEDGEDDVWIAYGWKKDTEGGYLVSDVDGCGGMYDKYDVIEEEDTDACGMSKRAVGIDGIEKLTNIVMFLEEKLNA